MIHVLKDFGPFSLVEVSLFTINDHFYAADVLYVEGKGYERTRRQMGDWVKDIDELVYQHVVDNIHDIIPLRDQ